MLWFFSFALAFVHFICYNIKTFSLVVYNKNKTTLKAFPAGRGGDFIIPNGADVIKSGDRVIVVTVGRTLNDLNGILK